MSNKLKVYLSIILITFLSGYAFNDFVTNYKEDINEYSLETTYYSDLEVTSDFEITSDFETYEIENTYFEETSTEIITEILTNANLEVNFIDVGQADACLLESDGHFMMIDAGNNDDSDLILNYLNSKNVKTIDYMIGTHPHEDHIGSMDTVINNFDVDNVYLPKILHTTKTFEDVLTAVENKNLKIDEPVAGNEFYFNGMTVEILAPIREYSDLNDNSIVLKITDGDVDFLFTGDIEKEAEYDIIQSGENLSADVLKVAHHGSDTSSSEDFIKKVSPEYAVISVGKDNSYGHPEESTLDLFNRLNIETYRTDQSGTITFKTDGENIDIINENNNSNNSDINILQNKEEPVNNKEDEKSYYPSSDEKDNSQPPVQTNTEKYYIGNKNTKKFHLPSCNTLPKQENQVRLNSWEQAVNGGYIPCKKCKPAK